MLCHLLKLSEIDNRLYIAGTLEPSAKGHDSTLISYELAVRNGCIQGLKFFLENEGGDGGDSCNHQDIS